MRSTDDANRNKCPSVSKIRKLLRDEFQLRYRVANAAKIKYNDVSYDDKRVWVSRLLSQFMVTDVVIVSIDESSFKQEGISKQYWQPSSKTIKQLFEDGPRLLNHRSDQTLAEEQKV